MTGRETRRVTFRLAGETYGVGILEVAEVVMLPPISRIPGAPPYVEGVARLRGRLVPIVCLRRLLRLPPAERDDDTRVVVTEVGGELAGLIVDAVGEIVRVPPASISGPPRMLAGGPDTRFLAGIAVLEGRTILLPDLGRVVDPEEVARIAGRGRGAPAGATAGHVPSPDPGAGA